MCRLYAIDGKRQKEGACINLRIPLDIEDLKLLSEIAIMSGSGNENGVIQRIIRKLMRFAGL